MLDQTDSFKRLKTEQQRILDFSKLVCYSVPSLKKCIKGNLEKIENYETLAKPDYFVETVDIINLKELSKHYKENLSKYVLLSSFSFFESYFRDVIIELIEFHGGLPKTIDFISSRNIALLNSLPTNEQKTKAKLKTRFKKRKWQKYKKLIDQLEQNVNYRHPAELFATYGVKAFFELVASGNFKSIMIPELIEIGLGMLLDEKINRHADLADKNLKETFHILRDIRNSIGHGKAGSLDFEKTMDLNRYLRFFSVKLDNHLIDHFFIIQQSSVV